MIVYVEDGKVITMVDAMNIVCNVKKYKKSKRDKFITKLQEWKQVYNNLGCGWMFSGNYIALRTDNK